MTDERDDLVEVLREGVDGDPNVGLAPANDAMREAADRIEALTAERDAALKELAEVRAMVEEERLAEALFYIVLPSFHWENRDEEAREIWRQKARSFKAHLHNKIKEQADG